MKNRITTLILTIGIIALMLAGVAFYAQTSASASTTKEFEISKEVSNINLESPISKVDSPPDITKQQINGIEIEIINEELMDNLLLVDICYQLPSDADWLLSTYAEDVVLTIGGKDILHSGFAEIETKKNADGKKTHRCDRVSFPIDAQENLSEFSITINHLVTSIPEQPDCDKAQIKLDRENTGIKIKCNKTNPSFSYEVTKKPENMNKYETMKTIENSFSEIIEGPWVFTTGLK